MTNKNFSLNVPRLREWIKLHGLKQNFVAEKIGMRADQFSLMLKSGRLPRSYEVIRRLSQVTKIKRADLLIPIDRGLN